MRESEKQRDVETLSRFLPYNDYGVGILVMKIVQVLAGK
jgi:hypothetical protein